MLPIRLEFSSRLAMPMDEVLEMDYFVEGHLYGIDDSLQPRMSQRLVAWFIGRADAQAKAVHHSLRYFFGRFFSIFSSFDSSYWARRSFRSMSWSSRIT